MFIKTSSGGSLPIDTVLFNEEVTGTNFVKELDYIGDFGGEDQPIIGKIAKATTAPFYKHYIFTGSITSSGFSLNTVQELDQ